jgi:intein/homing endonuclease
MWRHPKITEKDLENMATIEEFRANPIMAAEMLLRREYTRIQRYAIHGAWTHPFSMLDWGRGLGKALKAETRIMTGNGVSLLGNMIPENMKNRNELVVQDAAPGTRVLGPEGMRYVSKWIAVGKAKTRKFTTRKGYPITLCESNPTMSIMNGQIGWVSSGDLKVGDHLVLNRRNQEWSHTANSLHPDIARLMGYVVGDGYVSAHKNYSFVNQDAYCLEDYRGIHSDHFDLPLRSEDRGNGTQALYAGRAQGRVMEAAGLEVRTGVEKRTPEVIWGASRECQANFLRGLFDTDGTTDKEYGYVSYTSISQQLAEEVQFLLLSFGIISKLRAKPSHYLRDDERVHCNMAYEVSIISAKDCRLFYDRIGFGIDRKQERCALLSDKTNSNQDVIPGLKDCYAAIMAADTRRGARSSMNSEWLGLKGTLKGQYETTYEKLPRIIAYFEGVSHPAVDYLRFLLEQEFFFDPIVEIEEGEDYMYDLEIEPEPGDKIQHGFMANGLVVHNCVSGETVVHVRTKNTANNQWKSEYRRVQDLFTETMHRLEYDSSEMWGLPPKQIEVWSFSTVMNSFTWKPVVAFFRQEMQPDGMVTVSTVSGRRVHCTPSHKFYVRRRDGNMWVAAKDLVVGAFLHVQSENKSLIHEEVVGVEPIERPDQYVYDLCVHETHCFVANNIVIHNTTVSSDIMNLSAMLYPGTASLCVSGTMKQTKLIFGEIANTYNRSQLFRNATYAEPTMGSDECRLFFKSVGPTSGKRTKIIGVAPDVNKGGAGVRGQRCSRVLYIDEWIILPPDLIDAAIMPCAATTENPMEKDYQENLIRYLFSSSSGYSFDPAYKRMLDHRQKWLDGDPDYFYCNANYLDCPGFVAETAIKLWIDTIKTPNPGRWETEVMANWTSEAGAWYQAKDVMGDPENPEKHPGMWMGLDEDPDCHYETHNHEDIFVLSVDPAEQKDDASFTLLKVLPHRLVVVRNDAYPKKGMNELAEIIRWFMDHYNIQLIAMDPEGGGRAGITPELNRFLPKRINSFTGTVAPFLPVYEMAQDLKKGKEVPVGARQMIKYVKFSSTKNDGNLTDMNLTLRLLIQNRLVAVPKSPDPKDPRAAENFDMIKKGYEAMMGQLISIEAEPVEQTNKSKGTKSAIQSGRYSFTTKNGVKKDRWASLLIGAWEANYLQQQINVTPDDDGYQFVLENSIFDNPHGYGLGGGMPWFEGLM